MVVLQTIPLIESIVFEANKTKSIKIPRNRFLREIQLRLEAKLVNGNPGPTLQEDNPLGLVKRIRLVKNGKDIIFDVPMAERYYEMQYVQGTAPERVQHSATASATSTAIAEVTIDFSVDENNAEDISALLPAANFTDLELQIDWGTNTDLSTANHGTITVADTFMKVSLVEAEVTKTDLAALAAAMGGEAKMLQKMVRLQEFDVTAVQNNFNFSKNLTVGQLIQRHLVKTTDNSLRSDALVSRFRFRQSSPVQTDLEDRLFTHSQAKDKRRFKVESVVKGITIVNWEDKGFLDLTNLKEGDVKYEQNNIAPTGTSKVVVVSTEFG